MPTAQEPLIGIDLTQVDDRPQHKLGQKAIDDQGTAYRYVRAVAARTAFMPYHIRKIDFELSELAVQSNSANAALGVPQHANFTTPGFSSGYTYKYGWVATSGKFMVSATESLGTPPQRLYLTNTGGINRSMTTNYLLPGLGAISSTGGVGFATVSCPNELQID